MAAGNGSSILPSRCLSEVSLSDRVQPDRWEVCLKVLSGVFWNREAMENILPSDIVYLAHVRSSISLAECLSQDTRRTSSACALQPMAGRPRWAARTTHILHCVLFSRRPAHEDHRFRPIRIQASSNVMRLCPASFASLNPRPSISARARQLRPVPSAISRRSSGTSLESGTGCV